MRTGRPGLVAHLARPLRAVARGLRSTATPAPGPPGRGYDWWLQALYGEQLAALDAACADGGPACYALFRDLDVDLWALLLTQEYQAYPNIRSLLPGVPDPSAQRLWNGASGIELAQQSKAFYVGASERYAQHSERTLADSRVLDFGCGWGRLTRFFARDVEPGFLFGCDPVEQILDECRRSGVPATLARSDFLPNGPPFQEPFDLAFSFSVFTHISEQAHDRCLAALYSSLRPGGILILTIRPPDYLLLSPLMSAELESLGPDPEERLADPLYLFTPHPAEPSHFQYDGGEMTYGETVITLPYVRERWADRFELLDVDLLLADIYQVILTLRRR